MLKSSNFSRSLYTGSSTPKFDALKCLKLLGFKTVELTRRTWAPIGKGKFDAQVRRFWLTTIRVRVRSIAAATIQAPRPPALTTGGRDLPQRIGAHREAP
jgi:hypothetical protein